MRMYLAILLATVCLTGCRVTSNAKAELSNKALTAREMIENNSFLDISANELKPRTRAAIDSLRANPTFRAACYRFYKAVTIDENGIATCSARKGEDLNMSETLFENYMSDMENLNEMIRKDLERGIKGERSPLDDAYFERLLDERRFNTATNKKQSK